MEMRSFVSKGQGERLRGRGGGGGVSTREGRRLEKSWSSFRGGQRHVFACCNMWMETEAFWATVRVT